jgi:ParB-like chromosome segregation protein Spo0J
LVSTDEPGTESYGEEEAPLPVVPSRGVVLEKSETMHLLALSAPPLEVNEKSAAGGGSERLIVARLMPTCEGTASIEVLGAMASSSRHRRTLVAASNLREETDLEVRPSQTGWAAAAAAVGAVPSVVDQNVIARTSAPTEPHISRLEVTAQEKKGVSDFLAKWKRAWMQKDLDRFAKMYHPDFQQSGMDCRMFIKSKKNFFRKYQAIQVEVEQLEIGKANGRWVVRFLQSFQGDEYRDKGWKTMVLAGGKAEGFRILEEGWSPL